MMPAATATATATAVVELRNLVCAVDGRRLLAIDHLQIMPGERVAVLGPNGAGKSTLLRVIGGMLRPQQGSVRVLGRDLHGHLAPHALRALRQEVGQVMQGLHLVPRLSALENVLIGCLGRIGGWRSWVRYYPAHEVANANLALQEVGLLARATVPAHRLSGGERQKVAIARLLMQRTRLMLADEPTAALDPAAAIDVCHLLAKAAAGTALISVVHNPALLPVLAQRVIGIKHGVLVFDVPVAAVNDALLSDLYRSDARDGAPSQGARHASAGEQTQAPLQEPLQEPLQQHRLVG
jgi:phosphonate transport system ATP-binding protein